MRRPGKRGAFFFERNPLKQEQVNSGIAPEVAPDKQAVQHDVRLILRAEAREHFGALG